MKSTRGAFLDIYKSRIDSKIILQISPKGTGHQNSLRDFFIENLVSYKKHLSTFFVQPPFPELIA